MATSTNQELEQLKQQLKVKLNEAKDIYDKLKEAGVEELSDDILDAVTGGRDGDMIYVTNSYCDWKFR